MSTFTVKKFSGSITDFPIGADSSEYESADNLLLNEYEKLVSRPGTLLEFTDSHARARVASSESQRRISLMCPQETGTDATYTTLKVCAKTIQYDNATARAELQGPGSASAFPVSGIDGETNFSYSEWNKHTFITHDGTVQKPVKVYRDSSGNLQLRTAGLPPVTSAYTATSSGSGADYIYALVTVYVYTVGSITYTDRSVPVIKEFTGIGTATTSSSPAITVGSISEITNATGEHYDVTVIDIEVYRTTNAGTILYKVGSVDNATASYSDTTSDDDLVSNEILYTEGGVVANTRPPKSKYTHATSDFVYFANGTEVDTAGADLELQPQRVWQSKRGDPDSVPASFYGDVDAPITAISSSRSIPIIFTADATYRLDGYFDNLGRGGIIPKKISDSIGCISQNSCVQTLEGVFFAGTDGFYYTDGYQVVALSDKFRDSYSTFTSTELRKKRIYGALDLNEQRILWTAWKGTSEPYDDDCAQLYCLDLRRKVFTTWSSGYGGSIDITSTGVSNSGAAVTVSTTSGIDGGSYVFRDDETTPLAYGTYVQDIEDSTTVTLNYTAANDTGNTYYFINNNPEYVMFRNFLPTALLFANDKMYFGERHGYTLYFDKSQPDDVWLDPSETILPTNFEKLPIYFKYKGPFLDLGTTEMRKWVSMIIAKARPRLDINAEMTLQIKGENDDNDFPHSLEEIFFEQNYPWGTPLLDYGDPRLYRARRTIIDVKRRFPAGKQRCEYKQVSFEPAFVNIYFSNVNQNAAVAASGTDHVSTVIMASKTWPTDVFNYWLSVEADSYVRNYRIVSRDSNSQLSVHDPDGTLTAGADQKWVIRGLNKQALINLIEYTLFYEILGPSQTQYQGENTVSQ